MNDAYIPEGATFLNARHSSLTGTGTFSYRNRRVSPDAIKCVPFREETRAMADVFVALFATTACATAGLNSPPARGVGGRFADGVVGAESSKTGTQTTQQTRRLAHSQTRRKSPKEKGDANAVVS